MGPSHGVKTTLFQSIFNQFGKLLKYSMRKIYLIQLLCLRKRSFNKLRARIEVCKWSCEHWVGRMKNVHKFPLEERGAQDWVKYEQLSYVLKR